MADPATKGTNGELLPKLFIDVGRGLKPGELSMQPWAQALMTARSRNFQADDPITACKPVGGPRLDHIPTPIKIVKNPTLIVLMHEEEPTFRQIYTDGRKLPEDPEPSTFGYSTAKWEGGSLVVDTVGFRDQGWLDAIGHPHSDALHLTERFHRRDFGHIKVQIAESLPILRVIVGERTVTKVGHLSGALSVVAVIQPDGYMTGLGRYKARRVA